MKKRVLSILLVAAMLLTLAACGGSEAETMPPAPSESEEPTVAATERPKLTAEELEAMTPAQFIGRTVGDLFDKYGTEHFRGDFEDCAYLEFEGSPAYLLGFAPTFVLDEHMVRKIIAGSRMVLLDDIESCVVLPELENMVGDEVELGEPVLYHDALSMLDTYTVEFVYKDYCFRYVWYSDPVYSDADQVIVTRVDVPVIEPGY